MHENAPKTPFLGKSDGKSRAEDLFGEKVLGTARPGYWKTTQNAFPICVVFNQRLDKPKGKLR
jgi:hypothetical protein